MKRIIFVLALVCSGSAQVRMNYVGSYQSTRTYYAGNVVTLNGSAQCLSLVNNNTGNDPLSSTAQWMCSPALLGTPTSTVLAAPTSASAGSPVNLTGTVSPSNVTGSITFLDGATTLSTVLLSGSSATFSTSALNPGTHSLTAKYNGDSGHIISTSAATSLVVSGTSSTTTLAASSTTPVFGVSVTFTATVSPSAATGTATFSDGATALGTCTLASGTCTYSTSSLAIGTHSITASYGGDATYTSSSSSPITVTVSSGGGGTGTTYYVRPDGGTRYTARATSGQCDGKADVAYPGTGINQHCAFNDVRYLWQDGSYASTNNSFPAYGWILAGGDTALIRGSIGTNVTYRVGWPNSAGASYAGGCASAGQNQCFGVAGDNGSSGAPPIPSGTASQHTRILGENYASCHTNAAKTQLHGGYGVDSILNTTGSSYVDIQCLDLTDFSSCGLSGQTFTCATSGTIDDFARYGLRTSSTTDHLTVTDVSMHGLAYSGGIGPTANGSVFSYVSWVGNAGSGWNTDDGTNGTGTLNVSNFVIAWNGCAEQYGSTATYPYADCTDDQHAGYGDGFGTRSSPSSPGWQVTFDQGQAYYNTQDGIDALHVTGSGSSVTVSRTLAYGNMGNQIKVGGTHGSVLNSVIMQDCNAMSTSFTGTIAGYNSRISNFCRAGGDAVALSVGANSIVTFDDNTVYAKTASSLLIVCEPTQTCDATSKIDYRNNLVVGFTTAPRFANQVVSTLFTNAGTLFSNNLAYQVTDGCPVSGETSSLCSNPLLTDQTFPASGYADTTPTSSSPAKSSGVAISGVTLDYNGTTRGNPPTIGAIQ